MDSMTGTRTTSSRASRLPILLPALGLRHALFGDHGKSVIRAGFALTNDYYTEALATQFDINNTLGFTSRQEISANTFNLTTRPAPLLTGFDQDIRTLPTIVVPSGVTFPRQQPSDFRRRIQSGIDTALAAPNLCGDNRCQRIRPACQRHKCPSGLRGGFEFWANELDRHSRRNRELLGTNARSKRP